MAETFGDTKLELLQRHLQALVEVEFFTIPVYLTGVYSFTKKALGYSEIQDGKPFYPLYDLQQNALSVAVQEMYHLQLACNLANVFQVKPVIPTKINFTPGAPLVVPHIDPGHMPLQLELGSLSEMIDKMIAIEQPDEDQKEIVINPAVEYASIGDLYAATLELLRQFVVAFRAALSDPGQFLPGNKQIAYATFESTYTYNRISPSDPNKPAQLPPDQLLIKVINAVVDQGEGREVVQRLHKAQRLRLAQQAQQVQDLLFQASEQDNEVLPEFRPKAGSRFAAYGDWPHHKRFTDIQTGLAERDWAEVIGGDVFYAPKGRVSDDLPDWARTIGVEQFQQAIGPIWSYLVDVLQEGVESGELKADSTKGGQQFAPTFSDAMISFKYLLPIMWQWGKCPAFEYRAGVSVEDVQRVMDTVDPLCLFHWDKRTQEVRVKEQGKNACQGLNHCAGLGWGGIATQKGNGACATADLHTCGGNNSCRGEAGCGYLVSKAGEACNSAALQDHAASHEGRSGAPDRPGNLCGHPDDSTTLLPPDQEWVPGGNVCGGLGGCQTPISPSQVFSDTDKARNLINQQTGPGWDQQTKDAFIGLMGANVWRRARELFRQRESLQTLPDPLAQKQDGLDYDGDLRRKEIPPTTT